MAFKVIRNNGIVVCFGPDDEHYAPNVKQGETLTVEDATPVMLALPVMPSIQDQLDAIYEGGAALETIKNKVRDAKTSRSRSKL